MLCGQGSAGGFIPKKINKIKEDMLGEEGKASPVFLLLS